MRGFRISDFPSEIHAVFLLNTSIQQYHNSNLNFISTKRVNTIRSQCPALLRALPLYTRWNVGISGDDIHHCEKSTYLRCFCIIYCVFVLFRLCIFIIFMLLFIFTYFFIVLFMYSYCYVCSVYSVFIVPTGTLRLSRLRFFRAFPQL